ncbi:Prefoldin, partial [Gorgonomyces haynaldii]
MAANINLTELPVHQLQAIRQQLDQEIQALTQSFAQLKQAQTKFLTSNDALKRLDSTQKEGLIPLTNSLYVQATLKDQIMVDVGTGYFVDKSLKDAQEFYKRKSDFLKTNLETLQTTVQQRQNQRYIVIDVLQQKL